LTDRQLPIRIQRRNVVVDSHVLFLLEMMFSTSLWNGGAREKVGRLSPQAALTFYIGAFFGSLIGKFNFLSMERKKRRLGASVKSI
jgi:hypothetical protein